MPTTEERLDALEFKVRGLEIGQENQDIRADIEQALVEQPEPEPEPEEDLLLPEAVRQRSLMNALPEWSAGVTYTEGTLVKHNNRAWIALPDVSTSPPDDVYDVQACTGGWIPYEVA